MKRFVLLVFIAVSAIILLRLATAMAQEPSVTMSRMSPVFFPGESWGFRVESEFKSTRDKTRAVDGYQSQTDLRIYREFENHFAGILGSRVNQEERKQEREDFTADEGVIGIRTVFDIGDMKVRTDWTYNAIMNDAARKEEECDSYFQMESRTNFLLGFWGKARLRLKHWEFQANKTKDGTELRQSKIEFAPGYYIEKTLIGLRNQFIAHGLIGSNTLTNEIGPFIRYEGVNFEPIAKIIYRPVNNTPGFKLAGNWENEPIYSLELDLKF